jgi:hypothetical protein
MHMGVFAYPPIFHKLRSITIENFNEQFKGIFDGHG